MQREAHGACKDTNEHSHYLSSVTVAKLLLFPLLYMRSLEDLKKICGCVSGNLLLKTWSSSTITNIIPDLMHWVVSKYCDKHQHHFFPAFFFFKPECVICMGGKSVLKIVESFIEVAFNKSAIGNVNFDHLIKVHLAGLSKVELPSFHLQILSSW